MKSMSKALFVFMIFFILSMTVWADQNFEGIWDDWSKDQADLRSGSRYVPASETDKQSILNKLTEIVELLKKTPTLNPPAGADITRTRNISFTIPGWLKNSADLPKADLSLTFFPLVKSKDGSPKRARRATGFINIFVNETAPSAVFGPGDKSLKDEAWYLEPVPVGSAGPFTVYEPIYDARSGRTSNQYFVSLVSEKLPPLWFPVTNEEFFNDRVERVEKDLAEYKSNMEKIPHPVEANKQMKEALVSSYEKAIEMFPDKADEYRAEIEKALKEMENPPEKEINYYNRLMEAAEERNALLEKEIVDMRRHIAAFSDEYRNAQALGSANFRVAQTKRQAVIQPPGTPGGSEVRKVLRRNPEVFAAGFPADALTMCVVSFHAPKDVKMRELFEQVLNNLDWKALAGFLY